MESLGDGRLILVLFYLVSPFNRTTFLPTLCNNYNLNSPGRTKQPTSTSRHDQPTNPLPGNSPS